MRKLLCLIISAMLVLSAVSVNAEEYAADKQNTDFLILRELGIINGLNSVSYTHLGKFQRAIFKACFDFVLYYSITHIKASAA